MCGFRDLVVPRTRTVNMGPSSVYVSGPTLWNSLPLELHSYELTLMRYQCLTQIHKKKLKPTKKHWKLVNDLGVLFEPFTTVITPDHHRVPIMQPEHH